MAVGFSHTLDEAIVFMHRYRAGLVVGALVVVGGSAAVGQQYIARLGAPLSARSLSQLGLERVWQAHVSVDTSRGSLKFTTLHVSRSQWVTVYDVQYENATRTFDERQLDRFGQPIGIERAQFLADVERRVLETRGIEATVTERRVPSITLYAQTDNGVLHAMDAETGRTKWSFSVGSPRYPSLAPGASDRYVATVNGSTLYVFDLIEEKLAWEKRLGAAPGAGPALTQTSVYVPLLNGLVRGFKLTDGSNVVRLRSIGRPMVQPLITGPSLIWPTDRGYLYFVDTVSNEMRFRFETNSEILGNAAHMDPDQAIVTTDDGHAYGVNELSGEKLWQFSAGDTINSPPMVLGRRAYVISSTGELSSVDGDTGRLVWSGRGVKHVLSVSKDRLFALGVRGDLMAFDQETGALLGQVPTDFGVHVPNSISDRIYLGNSRGSLVCLRAAGQTNPILHVALPELDLQQTDGDDSDGKAPPVDDGSRETQPPSAAEDPFAVDDADPFSADATDDEANPFANDADSDTDTEEVTDPFSGDSDDSIGGDDANTEEEDPFGETDPFDDEDPFG